jgi:hypothetical protein
MYDKSYPCYYPGEFSPPTKYHLNTLHWLLSKPEIHRVNVVIGSDQQGQITQDQKARLWEMLFKSKFAPQAGIIKSKQNGPISEVYEAFNKDKNLPAFLALDENASRNKKLQEKFQNFPYFGIQIIPSQFHKSSKNLLTAVQNNDFEGVKNELPGDFSDDSVRDYMDILKPKQQDVEAPEEQSPNIDYKSRYTNMFNDGYWKNVFQPIEKDSTYTEI